MDNCSITLQKTLSMCSRLDPYWHSARNLFKAYFMYFIHLTRRLRLPLCAPPPPFFVSSIFVSSAPPLSSATDRFFSTSSSATPSASPAPSSSRRPVPRPAPRSPPTPCPVRPRSPRYLSAVLGRLGSRNYPAQSRTTPWSSRPWSRRSITAPCRRTPGPRRRCSHRGTHLP